jgi:predicted ArsR family transcriptional regulator
MGFKLALMNLWIPNYLVKKELDEVSILTVNALRLLVETHAPNVYAPKKEPFANAKTSQEKRLAMSKEHIVLVTALVNALGEDEAVKVGRQALFEVGAKLGRETRDLLGIGHANHKDLVKAAKVLYRVLDIDAEVEWHGKDRATLFVSRCSFAKEYSKVTCQILSAADEGAVSGLNPHMSMIFEHRMTEGCDKCSAKIEFDHEGGKRH